MHPRPPRTTLPRGLLHASLLALFVVACGGVPEETDLQKWAGSESGIQQLAQVVVAPGMPAATRVRALEVVVERGQELRVRGMLELIPAPADRQVIARQLVERLVVHVEQRTATQLAAKDAILMLARHLPPEQVDRAQRSIAAWAFSDISWDTPAAELKTKLESRLSSDQITELGPHGLEGAAILLASGFIAEQMVRYLTTPPTPAGNALLIKALGRFIPAFLNVNPLYLDSLRKTREPAAAALLFRLYRDKNLDQKARDACFSVGAMMLDQPTIKGQLEAAAPIIDELVAIGRGSVLEDRWLAAANIVAVAGGARLGDALSLFVDDKAYGDPDRNGNAVLDLCFALHQADAQHTALPPIESALASDSRIQRAIAIICAKALALEQVRARLSTLASTIDTKADISLADFLGQANLSDKKKVPLTLGLLAKNALEGLDLLAASNLPSLPEDKRKARHFIITVELRELGDRYARLVEERYRQSLATP